MGHQLSPRNDSPHLTPTEILERLRDEFAYVNSDAKAGSDQVGDMLAHLRRMKANFEKRREPPPMAAEVEHQISRLEAVRSEAISIVVIDDPLNEDASFSCTVIPGDDLIVGYASAQHEQSATPLVKRAAEALSYSMTLI